jgi:hypothetical protein
MPLATGSRFFVSLAQEMGGLEFIHMHRLEFFKRTLYKPVHASIFWSGTVGDICGYSMNIHLG